MKTPRNTERDADENPMIMLASAVVLGSSGAIEHQEAQGQKELVESEVLPTDRRPYRGYEKTDCDRVMEGWGIVFGEVVPGDPIFQYVTLPAGWKKVPSTHSMWSTLVDDQGVERAKIFYKAAFYDRSAMLHLTPPKNDRSS